MAEDIISWFIDLEYLDIEYPSNHQLVHRFTISWISSGCSYLHQLNLP